MNPAKCIEGIEEYATLRLENRVQEPGIKLARDFPSLKTICTQVGWGRQESHQLCPLNTEPHL